jgi:hypothetical protein
MATLTVPSVYPTIADAIQAAQPGDTIFLAAGYADETASITVENIILQGNVTNTGISVSLDPGIQHFTLAGSAAINVTGNDDANIITGNAGDNTINSGSGIDNVDGGLGTDRLLVDYSSSSTNVTGGTSGSSANGSAVRCRTLPATASPSAASRISRSRPAAATTTSQLVTATTLSALEPATTASPRPAATTRSTRATALIAWMAVLGPTAWS